MWENSYREVRWGRGHLNSMCELREILGSPPSSVESKLENSTDSFPTMEDKTEFNV